MALGKRIDDLRSDTNRQFEQVNTRLERIEQKVAATALNVAY